MSQIEIFFFQVKGLENIPVTNFLRFCYLLGEEE